MAAIKTITRAAGDTFQFAQPGPGQVPPNLAQLAVAVLQLQRTVNELITRYNAHTHGGITAGGANTTGVSAAVAGADVADTGLFVAAAS